MLDKEAVFVLGVVFVLESPLISTYCMIKTFDINVFFKQTESH